MEAAYGDKHYYAHDDIQKQLERKCHAVYLRELCGQRPGPPPLLTGPDLDEQDPLWEKNRKCKRKCLKKMVSSCYKRCHSQSLPSHCNDDEITKPECRAHLDQKCRTKCDAGLNADQDIAEVQGFRDCVGKDEDCKDPRETWVTCMSEEQHRADAVEACKANNEDATNQAQVIKSALEKLNTAIVGVLQETAGALANTNNSGTQGAQGFSNRSGTAGAVLFVAEEFKSLKGFKELIDKDLREAEQNGTLTEFEVEEFKLLRTQLEQSESLLSDDKLQGFKLFPNLENEKIRQIEELHANISRLRAVRAGDDEAWGSEVMTWVKKHGSPKVGSGERPG